MCVFLWFSVTHRLRTAVLHRRSMCSCLSFLAIGIYSLLLQVSAIFKIIVPSVSTLWSSQTQHITQPEERCGVTWLSSLKGGGIVRKDRVWWGGGTKPSPCTRLSLCLRRLPSSLPGNPRALGIWELGLLHFRDTTGYDLVRDRECSLIWINNYSKRMAVACFRDFCILSLDLPKYESAYH